MAFEPKKQSATDFHGGVKYENQKDGVEAETINNLIEGLLFAQENGGSGGGSGVDQDLIDQVNANKQEIERLSPIVEENEYGLTQVTMMTANLMEKDIAFEENFDGILDKAIKKGITDSTETLSDEEKTSACDWLGVIQKIAEDKSNYRVIVKDTNNKYRGLVLATTSSRATMGAIPEFLNENTITTEPQGSIPTKTPTVPYASANKKYVDDKIAELLARIEALESK